MTRFFWAAIAALNVGLATYGLLQPTRNHNDEVGIAMNAAIATLTALLAVAPNDED